MANSKNNSAELYPNWKILCWFTLFGTLVLCGLENGSIFIKIIAFIPLIYAMLRLLSNLILQKEQARENIEQPKTGDGGNKQPSGTNLKSSKIDTFLLKVLGSLILYVALFVYSYQMRSFVIWMLTFLPAIYLFHLIEEKIKEKKQRKK